MNSYSRLFVVFLVSVTVFALIPSPVVAVEPKLTIEPTKATFGQNVAVFVEYYDMKPHLVELTFYYGNMELDSAEMWINGSYTYQWRIKEQWADDPTTGGEGGYSIRLWVDNKTAWGELWVEKTWTQIAQDNERNTDRLISSNEALGRLIITAEYGAIGVVSLILVVLIFWGQNTAARKRQKDSWWDWIKRRLLRIRVFMPFLWAKADESFHEILNARAEFNKGMSGSPREWNFADMNQDGTLDPNSICARNRDMMMTIKKVWNRFQLARTYGTTQRMMAKKGVEKLMVSKTPKLVAQDGGPYPLMMNRDKE